jgi:hypothetical protein
MDEGSGLLVALGNQSSYPSHFDEVGRDKELRPHRTPKIHPFRTLIF